MFKKIDTNGMTSQKKKKKTNEMLFDWNNMQINVRIFYIIGFNMFDKMTVRQYNDSKHRTIEISGSWEFM